jgi:hypothetical protein
MENINTLYALLIHWTQTSRAKYIREDPTAVFLNININGQGFIGDDTGAIHLEFDTIQDGIEQLQIAQ